MINIWIRREKKLEVTKSNFFMEPFLGELISCHVYVSFRITLIVEPENLRN